MSAVIVDYGSGNLRSAAKAFERSAREGGYKGDIIVTDDAARILGADHIVLPGVGAFGDCKQGLAARAGVIDALNEAVIANGRPFLGICVGMQLMARLGLEHGRFEGLGWIDGEVDALKPSDPALKIPHMGWNDLRDLKPHALLEGIKAGDHAYFVHSYQMYPKDRRVVLAETEYGGPVTALVGRDNIAGTQFHPEKSQVLGLRLIANFLKWRP